MKGSTKRPGAGEQSGLAAHRLFRDLKAAFEALKIPYWLDQGTLLGVIREGNLLKTDHDLDLGMWADDYRKKGRALNRRLQQKGRFLETYKPHQLSLTDLSGNLSMINVAFYRRAGGRAVKKMYYPAAGRFAGGLIRVVRLSAHAGEGTLAQKLPAGPAGRAALAAAKIIPVPLWKFLCYSAGRSQYFFRPYFRMAVDEKFFLNLEMVEAAGLKLPVPGDPEAYLAIKYGPDWRTPREDWLYYRDDGAIVP